MPSSSSRASDGDGAVELVATVALAVAPFVVAFPLVALMAAPLALDFFLDDAFFGGMVGIGLWCRLVSVNCQNGSTEYSTDNCKACEL